MEHESPKLRRANTAPLARWLTFSAIALATAAMAQADGGVAATEPLTAISMGDKAMEAHDYAGAEAAYQRALDAHPEEAGLLSKLAEAADAQGKFALAADSWEASSQLTKDAKLAAQYREQGTRAREKAHSLAGSGDGKTVPSQPLPKGTLSKDPSPGTEALALYETAVAAIGQKRYGVALHNLNACLRSSPQFAFGYVARASSLMGLRRYAEAAVDYQYANLLNPNLASPLFGMGEAYAAMDRTTDARAAFDAFLLSNAPDATDELKATARERSAAISAP